MTRIRLRTDHRFIADAKARGIARWEHTTPEEWDTVPPAEPGDTWRVTWWRPNEEIGPLAGYDICCPQCRQVHGWTVSGNCNAHTIPGKRCDHEGVGSCWTWTGSAEDGTLTAMPSLYAIRACGWHGWLDKGEMRLC